MRATVQPNPPASGGLLREAELAEILRPPDRSSAPPEAALPASRIAFAQFKNNAVSRTDLESANALVLSLVSGHATYSDFESAMARYVSALEKLDIQFIAYSTARSGGSARVALGENSPKLYAVLAEVQVVLPLAEPVQFSGTTLVEFLRGAIEVARALELPDFAVHSPDRSIRPPHGSVHGAFYSSKLKGPKLDLATEIRRRQVEAHVAGLREKLGKLEAGAAEAQRQVDAVKAQIANPVLPPNHQRKAF